MTEDDRTALIDTNIKQLEGFRNAVKEAFPQGAQQLKNVAQQWATNQQNLVKEVLPRLGPAVQLAARSMMRWIGDGLAAAQSTEPIQNVGPQMRSAWSPLILGQVDELLALLKNPPDMQNIRAFAPPPGKGEEEKPNREQAEKLLSEGATSNLERAEGMLKLAAYVALGAGVLVVAAAAGLPFIFHPGPQTSGWPLAVAWSTRLLAVAVLVVASVQLFKLVRELMDRATIASKQRSLLKVLGAAAYLGKGHDQASALVELVRALSVEPTGKEDDQSLVVPSMLLKELPDVIKAFRAGR